MFEINKNVNIIRFYFQDNKLIPKEPLYFNYSKFKWIEIIDSDLIISMKIHEKDKNKTDELFESIEIKSQTLELKKSIKNEDGQFIFNLSHIISLKDVQKVKFFKFLI